MAPGAGSARQKSQPSYQTPNQPQIDPLLLEEQIRIRAHEIWLAHDGQGGSAEADWRQAEQEILNETKNREGVQFTRRASKIAYALSPDRQTW